MRSIYKGFLVATALGALATVPAKADVNLIPLVSGAGWSVFDFGGPNYDFQDFNGVDDTYVVTIAPGTSDTLRITDGYNTGDTFEIFINTTYTPIDETFAFDLGDIGMTSTPSVTPDGLDHVGGCWSCAFWTDGDLYSHLAVNLGPGTYYIQGGLDYSYYGYGAGAIELGAVPEPATWALMLAGFGGLGAMLRRSRRQLALATVA